jgi:hypothetical protein
LGLVSSGIRSLSLTVAVRCAGVTSIYNKRLAAH